MDHLKIQKPRLYAIRYCKIMKYFTSVVSTQRERDLPGFAVEENVEENWEERLFDLKENEYGSLWNEWSGEGNGRVLFEWALYL